ncbi:alginate lyase family protein [Porticoccaceae bacterium LTM1]|nr:alginate lyase family protein [Porticoccaceae bacterium LTM1]
MEKFLKYYNTLKYVKPSQLVYRVWRHFFRPKTREVHVVTAESLNFGSWVKHELYEPKLLSDQSVSFLNETGIIDSVESWNSPTHSKLWLYNLHYFDELNSFGAHKKRALHDGWLKRWVRENPPGAGNGWEPYPISLRSVNWIKAFLSGLQPDAELNKSLALQIDHLSQDLEKHLLGNHLFVNAKSLIFGGCYFQGEAADRWLKCGLSIYKRELNEQVLKDGGNFELTPMYHAIMLVDLLDLINLSRVYPNRIPDSIVIKTQQVANKMITWLQRMSHAQKEISFFNDSAMGVAPENSCIFDYAEKLGLSSKALSVGKEYKVFDMPDSGYVSVHSEELTLIADLAAIGPDYIPGHAHADTLSFEMSLGGQRLFVNSGISEYGLSKNRLIQRKTLSHNTVSVDSLDSTEVWSGFRVARRARILNRFVLNQSSDGICFGATHDGFRKQGCPVLHRREWRLCKNELIVKDFLEGSWKTSVGFLHLHPDVKLLNFSSSMALLQVGEYHVELKVEGGKINVVPSTYHPRFGVVENNEKLELSFTKDQMSSYIKWEKVA